MAATTSDTDDGTGDSPSLLTPSKVAGWLACAHSLTLTRQVEEGERPSPATGISPFPQMLMRKGTAHEHTLLERYQSVGADVVTIDQRLPEESFEDWCARVEPDIRAGHEVLYQVPFAHDEMRGVADFLERVDRADGTWTYEPVDAKLARAEAKPAHVLQLCFYADAITALLDHRPQRSHVDLGSGERITVRLAEVAPYWRRVRHRLRDAWDEGGRADTEPVPCRHCDFCEFQLVCGRQWRQDDALHLVAGIRPGHRAALEEAGVDTVAGLGALDTPVAGLDEPQQARLHHQAALQVEARQSPDATPPYRHIPPAADNARLGHGHRLLPAPDEGDVFIDFEGHPFWSADRGLFFLFGMLERDDTGAWSYVARWAHDPEEELQVARWLVRHIEQRRRQHPGMHAYHYNHTERTSLLRLFREHGVDASPVEILDREGTLVDLLEVVRNAVQIGVESYGLKELERIAGFERSHDIGAGAAAVVTYEDFTDRVTAEARAGHTAAEDDGLARIAAYNRDDVRSTLALREWLLDVRPEGTPFRIDVINDEPDQEETDALTEGLYDLGGEAEQLLADLLGYWRLEDRVHAATLRAFAETPVEELRDHEDAVVDLYGHRLVNIPPPTGRQPKRPTLVASLSQQAIDPMKRVMYLTPDGPPAYADSEVDLDEGVVRLKVDDDAIERDDRPSVVVANDHVFARRKPDALEAWASSVIDAGGVAEVDDAQSQLLRKRPTRFTHGHQPAGELPRDLDAQAELALHLDRSYLAMQGPPGTGKTYRAARIIRRLLLEGKRVGVTALSHAAIANLAEEVHRALAEVGEGRALPAVVKRRTDLPTPLSRVEVSDDNAFCANPDFNLVAGTPWLFANRRMREQPVDVLVVDEAGQLGLADVLAAAGSARNLVLTGDPQQLPQVTQATHPGGSGASVLEHVLDGRDTLPQAEGLFLEETWRLHPDICEFISEQFYDGRLSSVDACTQQGTEVGTGLRWVRAEHRGCSTRSREEVALVAQVVEDLLGRGWTDQHGEDRTITTDDVLVVAPYNRQKDALRARLDQDPRLAGVRAGTVDKFQGQEAAVVIFSATASTGVPRLVVQRGGADRPRSA